MSVFETTPALVNNLSELIPLTIGYRRRMERYQEAIEAEKFKKKVAEAWATVQAAGDYYSTARSNAKYSIKDEKVRKAIDQLEYNQRRHRSMYY